MKTIGIDQSLSNNSLYEQNILQKTIKVHKHAGKRENQQQFKDILEDAMFSTSEGFTDNSHRSPMT